MEKSFVRTLKNHLGSTMIKEVYFIGVDSKCFRKHDKPSGKERGEVQMFKVWEK